MIPVAMEFLLVVLTIVLVVVSYLWVSRPDPRLPPCPSRPWPLIGHLPIMQEDSRVQFKQWRQQLGDLFSVYMGRQLVVVVSGYDMLKEIFVKKGDFTSDRPAMFFDEATGYPGKGVIMSSGSEWREQRSVMLSILKHFGMGRNLLSEKIQEEAGCYLDALASLRGQATDLRVVTNISTSNLLCSVLIGQRFQYDDPLFQQMMTTLDDIVADIGPSQVVTYVPALKYMPGDFFRAKRLRTSVQKIMTLFVDKFAKAKVQDNVTENADDNFIAAYMQEWQKKVEAKEPTTMSHENLAKIIWDLFNAGTETASTTLLWCLLYAINYPEAQKKIYAEIESEIGTERIPSYQDKAKLVYLNAFIMEVQRLASVAALSLPRGCSADITVGGYTLPKDTVLIPNLDSVSYDEVIWGDEVDVLHPERFIDEYGKLKNPEELIAFGIGRRVCPGANWAKTVLFGYLAAMFQRFKFEPADPHSPPPIKYIFSIDVVPAPFQVKVIDRRSEN